MSVSKRGRKAGRGERVVNSQSTHPSFPGVLQGVSLERRRPPKCQQSARIQPPNSYMMLFLQGTQGIAHASLPPPQ